MIVIDNYIDLHPYYWSIMLFEWNLGVFFSDSFAFFLEYKRTVFCRLKLGRKMQCYIAGCEALDPKKKNSKMREATNLDWISTRWVTAWEAPSSVCLTHACYSLRFEDSLVHVMG